MPFGTYHIDIIITCRWGSLMGAQKGGGMRAYNVSKEGNCSLEEKIALVKSYGAGDLLYVLRKIEKIPTDYDEIIIKGVVGRLYDMGIKCI